MKNKIISWVCIAVLVVLFVGMCAWAIVSIQSADVNYILGQTP